MLLSTQTHITAARFGDHDAIAMLANAGYDAVDFTMFSSHNEKELFGDDYEAYAHKLKERAKECGIFFNQAHAPFPSNRLTDPVYTENVHKKIERSIEICGILGVRAIVVHPVKYPDELKKENMSFYNSLLPAAKKAGVKIALENMWARDAKRGYIIDSSCSDADSFCAYLDSLDQKYFTACLDLGHVGLVGRSEADMIRALGHKRLTCLHVHDTNFTEDLHTVPFSQRMDWNSITQALREIRYSGELTFEADNFLVNVPDALIPTSVKYMHDVGRFLIKMVEG